MGGARKDDDAAMMAGGHVVRAAALIGFALAVAGCGVAAEDAEVCSRPPSLAAEVAATPKDELGDAMTAADACIHRWAYRLARSDDPAPDVAAGVIGACRTPIARWGEALGNAARDDAERVGRVRLVSSETGEADTPERIIFDNAADLAIFRVVQARAGRCSYKARGE